MRWIRPGSVPLLLLTHQLAMLCCSPSARAAVDDPFVRVEGTRFVVEDKPFSFVGANLHVVHGEHERAHYRETIAAAAHDGLTVGRVWAFGEGPADAGEWLRRHELFRASPDDFIEDAYAHLDRVLAEAHARGLRLILTLSNHWGDYGGVPQYLRWAGLPDHDAPGLEARDAFYRDERLRAVFRAGLDRLLDRINSVTGVPYRDDPTIFAWELMNESSAVMPATVEARLDWIDEMAWYLKARDPRHLVAAGLWGYGTRSERAEWIRVHRLPGIDYCDSHLYPQTTERVSSVSRLLDLIDDRAQLARFVVGKPLVIGEFGFRTDRRQPFLGEARTAWTRRLLDRVFHDGGAGALVWIYQSWTGRARDFGIYADHRRTDDMRRVLRAIAARLLSAPAAPDNARVCAATGDRPLYDLAVTVRGPAWARSRAHDRRSWTWRSDGAETHLDIAPAGFEEARFERAGTYDGGPLTHVYGEGAGDIAYRFGAPAGAARRTPAAVRIAARVSSEWPGSSAPSDGGSTVEVRIDDTPAGTVRAIPDDGLGAVEEVVVTDPRLLRRLARGTHRLRFVVADTPAAQGLCIYGAAPAPPPLGTPASSASPASPARVTRAPPRDAVSAGRPASSPIRITYVRRAPAVVSTD